MEQRADYWAEEILEIANDGQNDYMEMLGRGGNNTGWKENGEFISCSKVRIEARKWLMGKAALKKYGDKLDINANHSCGLTFQLINYGDKGSKAD